MSGFVLHLLKKLGVEDLRTTNEGYESRCPFHHGSSRNFRVSRNGLYCCQNSYCGAAGNVVRLCRLALGIPYKKVVVLLKEQGIQFDKKVKLVTKPISIDNITPFRRYPIPYLLERGYQEADIRLYDIVYNPITNRILIPTYDGKGQLMALTSREPGKGKPYIQEANSQKSWYIFGAYQARQAKCDAIVINEGHFDPLGCKPYTEYFPTAIGGCVLSDVQARLAVRYFKKQVICLDNDKEGRIGTYFAIQKLRKAGSTNLSVLVYTAADPGDFPITKDLEIEEVSTIEWLRYNRKFIQNYYREKAKAKARAKRQ